MEGRRLVCATRHLPASRIQCFLEEFRAYLGRCLYGFAGLDTTTSKYYLAPMLLPDWEALRKGIADHCKGTSPPAVVEVVVQLEFGRDNIRQEIAELVSQISNKPISKHEIFYFPYAWISVKTGLRSQLSPQNKIAVRLVAETPPGAKETTEARALQITEPQPVPAHLAGTCQELRTILDNRDITGTYYAPTKHTQVNSFSVEFKFHKFKSVQDPGKG
jgi:hypothetical protein